MAAPSLSTSIRRTTPTEKLLYASNPLVIGSTRDVVQKAYQEAERRFPPHTQEDGDGDAFRHCYAAALLVREIGVNNTIALTEAHEEIPGNPTERRDMDRYNNFRGIEIGVRAGRKATDDEIADRVLAAMRRRELRTISPRNWPDVTKP